MEEWYHSDRFGICRAAEAFGISARCVRSLPDAPSGVLIVAASAVSSETESILKKWHQKNTVILLIDDVPNRFNFHDYRISPPTDADHLLRIACALNGVSVPRQTETEQERMTRACLNSLSVPEHLLGFTYLLRGVQLLFQNPTWKRTSMMYEIYPWLASYYGTTTVMADRAIRHAVEVSWNKCDPSVVSDYLGYDRNDKKGIPTNAEFLYMLYERIRMLTGDIGQREKAREDREQLVLVIDG